MNKDQEQQKWHVCRFCEQSFSNGKKLGGHMRGHLALISATRKESVQESINGEKGVDLFDRLMKKSQDCGRKKGVQDDDDGMVNKSQQEMDVDQDYGANANNNNNNNVSYVLRENPKRSWRVSNSMSKSDSGDVFCKQCGKGFESSKALAAHMRCHSSKESVKITTVCEKCGKVFDSMKALYGHMRCHSIKRSQALDGSSTTLSSNDDGLANPMRKKRSYTRHNNKSDQISTSLSSCCDGGDDEEEVEGAVCLMMLSRGVRNLDGVKLVISNQADFAFSDYGYSRNNVDFEVSVDGSMEFCKLKNKSKMGLEKDLVFANGIDTGRVGSTLVKYKSSIKKPKSCDGDTDDVVDSKISVEVKNRSKDHICSICFKEFRSSQALGSHKRIHFKTESKAMEVDHNVDIDTLDLDFQGGIDYGDVEFKLRWVQSNIEWDPLTTIGKDHF